MENWQLTLVILASLFVGALLPVLVMGAVALYRAGSAIAQIGARLERTLTQVEVVSDRVEMLTRGLKGGEANIADLLTSVGHLARSLEHNMKTINVVSAVIASIGTAIAAWVRPAVAETGQTRAPAATDVFQAKPPRSPSPVSPEATVGAQQQDSDFAEAGLGPSEA
jgi:hypothetical protein